MPCAQTWPSLYLGADDDIVGNVCFTKLICISDINMHTYILEQYTRISIKYVAHELSGKTMFLEMDQHTASG